MPYTSYRRASCGVRVCAGMDPMSMPVAGQAPKRLVGFQKVLVEPGESKSVAITIDPGGDEPPVRRLGLLHPQFLNQAGGVHRLRGQLGRQHSAHDDSHRWLSRADVWIGLCPPRRGEPSAVQRRQPLISAASESYLRSGGFPSSRMRLLSSARYSSSSKSRGHFLTGPAGEVDGVREPDTMDAVRTWGDQRSAVENVGGEVLQHPGVLGRPRRCPRTRSPRWSRSRPRPPVR